MRYFIGYLWLMLLATCGLSAEYTLPDCITIGMRESGAALNARQDQEIAYTKLKQAYSLALPHFSANAAYTRLDELQRIDLGAMSQNIGTVDNYDVNARVEQLLYSGGQVGAALSAARTLREYSEFTRIAVESILIRDIEIQFYGILLAREEVEVQAESVKQLEGYVEQTERRSKSGTASEFDLLTAQVRLANEKPKLISAHNRNTLEVARLVTLLNMPDDSEFKGELEQKDIDFSLDDMLRLALVNRADLHSSELRVDMGEDEITNARSEGLPEVRAHFNYNGANSYRFVSFEEEWEWHWNAGLVMRWNVWDGDLTRYKVKQKEAEQEKLITNYDQLIKNVKLDVRQAYSRLVHAREAMIASRDNVALAERALEIANTRYKTGLTTYLEFTDSNLARSTAHLVWLRSLHTHAVALAEVRYAIGENDKR